MKPCGIVYIVCMLLASCSPTLHPSITVLGGVQMLQISGTGFSPTSPCANLGIIGLPQPNQGSLGVAYCSGGHFENYSWYYQYFPGCLQSHDKAVTVSAFDISTLNPAFAATTIPWGGKCGLLNFCGKIGLPACEMGCLEGGVTLRNVRGPAPFGDCVKCGGNGQPVCSYTSSCNPGLHPNLHGGDTICTNQCGEVNQSACITDGSQVGVTYIYHCYDGATMDSSCVCVWDSNYPRCQEINSGSTGVCVPTIYIPQPGQSYCR